MAQIVYSENALDNLERLFNFLLEQEPSAVATAATVITEAVETFHHHPLLGCPIKGGYDIRELIISYGKTGYVALYRFVPARDQIRILAVRHQFELDYPV